MKYTVASIGPQFGTAIIHETSTAADARKLLVKLAGLAIVRDEAGREISRAELEHHISREARTPELAVSLGDGVR